MSDAITPFRCDIPQDVLDDLRERLRRTRFPDEVNDENWSYGTDLAYLKELCEYWREKFDWRQHDAGSNSAAPQLGQTFHSGSIEALQLGHAPDSDIMKHPTNFRTDSSNLYQPIA